MATAPSPVNTMLASIPRKWRSSDGDPKQGEGQLSGLLAGKLDAELQEEVRPASVTTSGSKIPESERTSNTPVHQALSLPPAAEEKWFAELPSRLPP